MPEAMPAVSTDDDADSDEARLDMAPAAFFGIINGSPAFAMAKTGLETGNLTAAQRAQMRGLAVFLCETWQPHVGLVR
jgi:hypothetical protein